MGPLEQRRMIREGMDATIVERVATNLLHLSVPMLLVHISLPRSTSLRRIKRAERLTASESDRIARVLVVLEHAREVSASAALAAEWMQRGNATLGGL
jgi:putative toxin-antitoxin system antitoxin component (TIGR02293 family)